MLNTKASPTNDSPADEALQFARETGLRYVRDDQPGFTRQRRGKGFLYLDPDNCKVSNDDVLHRIRSLVLPPAWQNVWICRFGNGHLQATGRDTRTRKQYRYHNKWSQARNETKFNKLQLFGELLPQMRERIQTDLKENKLSREKVLATVIHTMELTQIRVGNDVYAEENNSYGLTTILNKHVEVHGNHVDFNFRGKSGVVHQVSLDNPALSRVIKRCQELPGQELFAYIDEEGQPRDIGSSDVNDYLREISGESITAKDFRTWGGSSKAIQILTETNPLDAGASERARKARELEVIKQTAAHLGNTVAVCRKYYVHPLVFEADRDGSLHRIAKAQNKKRASGLNPEERVLLKLLES